MITARKIIQGVLQLHPGSKMYRHVFGRALRRTHVSYRGDYLLEPAVDERAFGRILRAHDWGYNEDAAAVVYTRLHDVARVQRGGRTRDEVD